MNEQVSSQAPRITAGAGYPQEVLAHRAVNPMLMNSSPRLRSRPANATPNACVPCCQHPSQGTDVYVDVAKLPDIDARLSASPLDRLVSAAGNQPR